jgi:hypothetical protein
MKQAIAIVVGVVLVVGGAIFAISRVADVSSLDSGNSGKDTDAEKARAWDADANAAFGGTDLTQGVVDMVAGAREWQAGERPIEQYKADLEVRRNRFQDTVARLDDLRPYPFDKRVNNLYQASAQLYLQTVEVYRGLVDTPPGDVRTQTDLLARRVRALADRVFDRGHELVKPKLDEETSPDVDIRLPEEVPDWVADGMAAGPPLEPAPPPPVDPNAEPQLRKPIRPDQPRKDWLAALRRLDIPSPKETMAAIASHDDAALASHARRLVAAAESLRTTPDPQDDREESARIRLSLLVDADAARAGQLRLDAVARRMLQVGHRLWVGEGLPRRDL